MQRLAWFTPLPPIRSGIAQYSSELLPPLTSSYVIDVFVDGSPEAFQAPPGTHVFSAHDFVWKHHQTAYALVVYQVGNASCHDYMWPYLVRWPGLVVLHDGQVHHARARSLLQQKRADDYRREFQYNHPDADPDVTELGISGLLGSLTYLWPMLRAAVVSSRRVLVHNARLAQQIHEHQPEAPIDIAEMGVPAHTAMPDARQQIRSRWRIADTAVVFMALGNVTPEKRLLEALHALASISEAVPDAHVLLAGETVGYYDVSSAARALGIEQKLSVAGYIADADMPAYLEASDVCLCLRWPTSRETSASWLRCLAAGRPTVTTDLAHTVDVPMLDPRNWNVLRTDRGDRPVGVSIDILDEDHSLKLALRRLASDGRLREALAANALNLWAERFDLNRMVVRYADAIAAALDAPASTPASLPQHLQQDGLDFTERQLGEFRLPSILRGELPR